MNLDDLRARAEAATEGPWYHGGDPRVSQQMFEPHELIVSPTCPIIEFESGEQGVADAEFAAHAREDIPALLAEVERLRSAGACPACTERCAEERGDALDESGDVSGSASPGAGPRPSVHNPITKSYAIDQITDIEHLRRVAHRMWEAFAACHAQSAHSMAVLSGFQTCEPCQAHIRGDRDTGCEQYQQWQRKVSDGFGSV